MDCKIRAPSCLAPTARCTRSKGGWRSGRSTYKRVWRPHHPCSCGTSSKRDCRCASMPIRVFMNNRRIAMTRFSAPLPPIPAPSAASSMAGVSTPHVNRTPVAAPHSGCRDGFMAEFQPGGGRLVKDGRPARRLAGLPTAHNDRMHTKYGAVSVRDCQAAHTGRSGRPHQVISIPNARISSIVCPTPQPPLRIAFNHACAASSVRCKPCIDRRFLPDFADL